MQDIVDAAASGLRNYVRRIATALGVGLESAYWELADLPSAYVALGGRMPRHPTRDVALTWDGNRGWAVGMEVGGAEELLVISWYGPDLVPAPDDVVGFAKSVFTEEPPSNPPPPDADPTTVLNRLAAYD